MSVAAGSVQAATPRSMLSGRMGLVVYYAVVVALGLLMVFGHPKPPGGGVAVYKHVESWLLDGPDAAPKGPGRPAKLPFSCGGMARTAGCDVLFRLSFDRPASDERPWSLYMPTYSGRLRIRLNGANLLDTHDIRVGVVLNQSEPLLAPLASPLLRDGKNDIEIRLDTQIAIRLAGFLDRVYIGPDSPLRAAYDARHRILKTLPQMAVAWQAALALSLLIVWFGRRQERMYGALFAILCLGALHGLPLFLLPNECVQSLLLAANLTTMWQASLLPGLVAGLVGRRPPLPGWRAVSLPIGVTGIFALRIAFPTLLKPLFPTIWVMAALPWTAGMQLLAVWILLVAAVRQRDAVAQFLLGGLLLIAIMCARDLLVFFGALPDNRVLLSQFTNLLMTTMISAVLMWRFAMALNEVSRFNRVLRQEVARAEAALRASFAREQVQIRNAALESERLRLTHDLHDGLAGQLVSIVAQCELQGHGFRSVSQAARKALEDLRLVVASLDDVGEDLAIMLAKFREQIEPQLHAQGIKLHWQMTPLPDIGGLRSEHALSLFRILQEAVGNAARHSGSDEITIAMSTVVDNAREAVQIVVADDGNGGAACRSGGNGLANMRRRAKSLGADFAIESGVGGTRVVIRLPLVLPDVTSIDQ